MLKMLNFLKYSLLIIALTFAANASAEQSKVKEPLAVIEIFNAHDLQTLQDLLNSNKDADDIQVKKLSQKTEHTLKVCAPTNKEVWDLADEILELNCRPDGIQYSFCNLVEEAPKVQCVECSYACVGDDFPVADHAREK